MKNTIEIIGPCSKWVEGKGWVTQIPIHLILNAGFHKTIQETNSNVSNNTSVQETRNPTQY